MRDPTWFFGLSPDSAAAGCQPPPPPRASTSTTPVGAVGSEGAAAVSPGIILAALIVAIGAQATRLLVPGRGNYVLAVLWAAAGLFAAELVALSGRGGPSLGIVHPAADALGIIIAEAVGLVLASPRRLGGR